MSEARFTKGWWAPREQTGERWYVDSEHGNICIVSYPDDGDDAANARLIAASPELYGAVTVVDERVTAALKANRPLDIDTLREMAGVVRAALARVHGEAEAGKDE